jgi:septum site-determining protein MinC
MSMVEDKASAILQLKADFFPLTIVRITQPSLDIIQFELDSTIQKAPKYLHQAPVVIDLRDMPAALQGQLSLETLITQFRERHVLPVGVRGLDKAHHAKAVKLGLAIMKQRDVSIAEGHGTSPAAKVEKTTTPKPQTTAKVLTRPARSGTQIYARNTDLVALTAINPGAECLADGNIHVYGPLRGRALAGANGNKDAHIFCESLEAELIAIAGTYLTKDQIKPPKTNKPLIHIYLKDDKLQIEGI